MIFPSYKWFSFPFTFFQSEKHKSSRQIRCLEHPPEMWKSKDRIISSNECYLFILGRLIATGAVSSQSKPQSAVEALMWGVGRQESIPRAGKVQFDACTPLPCAEGHQLCLCGSDLYPLWRCRTASLDVQVLQQTNQCFWNGNYWGTPAAPAALLPAPEGSQSLSKCLCEIKIDHLFPQILSNNLSLIKSKILFAWLPVVLERNYHPYLQLWEKWGKAINDLGWGTTGIVHRGTWCALLPAGHETSAPASSKTLEIFWRPWNYLLCVYFSF